MDESVLVSGLGEGYMVKNRAWDRDWEKVLMMNPLYTPRSPSLREMVLRAERTLEYLGTMFWLLCFPS